MYFSARCANGGTPREIHAVHVHIDHRAIRYNFCDQCPTLKLLSCAVHSCSIKFYSLDIYEASNRSANPYQPIAPANHIPKVYIDCSTLPSHCNFPNVSVLLLCYPPISDPWLPLHHPSSTSSSAQGTPPDTPPDNSSTTASSPESYVSSDQNRTSRTNGPPFQRAF